jgi:hypothetical protein
MDPEACYEGGPNSFNVKCNSTHYIQNICDKTCQQCKPFLQTPHGCQPVGENSINRRCGKIGNIKEKGYIWKHYYGSSCEGASHFNIFYDETCIAAASKVLKNFNLPKSGSTRFVFDKKKGIANLIIYASDKCSGEIIESMQFKPKNCYNYRGHGLEIQSNKL